MHAEIRKILLETPSLKAKEIAKRLGVQRKEVNSFLSRHKDEFNKDSNYYWSIANTNELRVEFEGNKWVDAASFESSLADAGSPLEAGVTEVFFVIPKNCSMLLDAATRLLALCNQLVWQGREVTIDFKESEDTLSYFDRIGFLKHLNDSVGVLPCRPLISRADLFEANSDAVVEFGEIDPNELDESIPKQLKNSFVSHSGSEYSNTAFTIISELYGNVRDHSESPIPGLVGLQYYKRGPRGPHIQTVISDSGKGIVGTLKPILNEKYPVIAQKYDFDKPESEVYLVKEVFDKGHITQTGEDGRGLGLKRSRDVAAKYDATVSIRQEKFELRLLFKDGVLSKETHSINLPRILGTHICFDFLLDAR